MGCYLVNRLIDEHLLTRGAAAASLIPESCLRECMKNLSVRGQLLLGFGLVIAVFVILATWIKRGAAEAAPEADFMKQSSKKLGKKAAGLTAAGVE